MLRCPTTSGIAVGLLLALLVLALLHLYPLSAAPLGGPILSECTGSLRTLCIQYVQDADFTHALYRDFLRQLSRDVTVHVLCPDRPAYDNLTAAIGQTDCRLIPVLTAHDMTPWSRDRFVVLAPLRGNAPVTLLAPCRQTASQTWPARAGDQRIAADLCAASPAFHALTTDLYFDGGDFAADDLTVFVTPSVLQRNLQHTVDSPLQLLAKLRSLTARNVILLDDAPPHHAAMFMIPLPNRTALVADPSLGKPYADSIALNLPNGLDFSPATQRQFDSVAKQLSSAGYRVIRIPTVLSPDGRTYLTYVNVILEHRDGQPIVYLPFYQGAGALNAAAQQVWSSLGYQIRLVDCTFVYPHFGALHCLVQVLQRG